MTTQTSGGFGATVDRSRAVLHGARLSGEEDYRVEERRKAALCVASRAHGVEDCRLLLEALGIVDDGVRWERSVTSYGDRSRRRKVTG